MEELTTRLDDTGEPVQLKLKENKTLEGYLVAIDKEGKPLPNQPEEVPSDVSLSDEELEEQFQALSASDKLRYNQWYAFHHEYQHRNNIARTATQIIRHISNQNKPNIPPIIVQTELADVKPILIKKEISQEYASVLPFDDDDAPHFTNTERVPFRETTRGLYDEEVTDEEDYVSDDHPIEIDSDSRAALSMTDDGFEATNPHKVDDALQDIVDRLKKAANGFEELRSLVPSIPVTEIPKLLETVRLPYIQPLTKPMVQAIKNLGEAKMIELAVQEEHKKGTTQVSIMSNYGLTRNQVYKAITGVRRPGGSQYEAMKKEVKEESPRKTEKAAQQGNHQEMIISHHNHVQGPFQDHPKLQKRKYFVKAIAFLFPHITYP